MRVIIKNGMKINRQKFYSVPNIKLSSRKKKNNSGLKVEKPDALFIITDPRYFSWLFQVENEIRKNIPIIYLNIWDDYPAPMYNKPYYEACDLLMGISKQTVNINKLVL